MFTKSSAGLVAVIVTLSGVAVPLRAQPLGCFPPVRPFVPSDLRDVQSYSDLIRQDFEAYLADFGVYLGCLDTERARVFAEAQEVTAEYGRFQSLSTQLGPAPE